MGVSISAILPLEPTTAHEPAVKNMKADGDTLDIHQEFDELHLRLHTLRKRMRSSKTLRKAWPRADDEVSVEQKYMMLKQEVQKLKNKLEAEEVKRVSETCAVVICSQGGTQQSKGWKDIISELQQKPQREEGLEVLYNQLMAENESVREHNNAVCVDLRRVYRDSCTDEALRQITDLLKVTNESLIHQNRHLQQELKRLSKERELEEETSQRSYVINSFRHLTAENEALKEQLMKISQELKEQKHQEAECKNMTFKVKAMKAKNQCLAKINADASKALQRRRKQWRSKCSEVTEEIEALKVQNIKEAEKIKFYITMVGKELLHHTIYKLSIIEKKALSSHNEHLRKVVRDMKEQFAREESQRRKNSEVERRNEEMRRLNADECDVLRNLSEELKGSLTSDMKSNNQKEQRETLRQQRDALETLVNHLNMTLREEELTLTTDDTAGFSPGTPRSS